MLELVGIAVGASRPMECQRRKNARHRMVGMPGNSPCRAECNHHLWLELAHAHGQVIDNAVQVLPVQLSVWIIENDWPRYLQNCAGRREFLPAKLRKFLIIPCTAAIGSGLTRS